MDIKEFVLVVELMRKMQKGCYSCFTTNQLKQLKAIEKTVDEKIITYHKEELEKLRGDWLINEH